MIQVTLVIDGAGVSTLVVEDPKAIEAIRKAPDPGQKVGELISRGAETNAYPTLPIPGKVMQSRIAIDSGKGTSHGAFYKGAGT
jgi:hypothetical protein